jgi:hypothetical protein
LRAKRVGIVRRIAAEILGWLGYALGVLIGALMVVFALVVYPFVTLWEFVVWLFQGVRRGKGVEE